MRNVSQTEFNAFVESQIGFAMAQIEPRIERDGEYGYVCYDNKDGQEIAFISRRGSNEPTYLIRDEPEVIETED